MTPEGHYPSTESLELFLGDPLDDRNAFSYRRAMELDESEDFPADLCKQVQDWGLQEYFVPAELGGKLTSFPEAIAILRLVSRRDLSVAIALGQIFLGAIPVWIAASPKQKHRLADLIRRRNLLAFALTEQAHGSDIQANEVRAEPVTGGYLLSGEKWLINNATVGRALSVFARTSASGGPRGFGFFLVEKDSIDPERFQCLPKARTLGIRGVDISGIRFDRCFIPETAGVGSPGTGLEVALKGLMVTRTLCAGLSLGAADSALRVVLRFAQDRILYGEPVLAIPQVRRALASAFADLLICECVSAGAARGLHIAPGQFSVWSAVVKYFVPTTVEKMIQDLARVLGARYYLRDHYLYGVFQKILRDNAVVSLFDGSTAVNLNAIAIQLRSLAAGRRDRGKAAEEERTNRLASVFSLSAELSRFDPSGLSLFNRGEDLVLQTASQALARLEEAEGLDTPVREASLSRARGILALMEKDEERWRVAAPGAVKVSADVFEGAQRYCVYHAAFACLHLWLHNQERLGEFFRRGEWLALSLERLSRSLAVQVEPLPSAIWESVSEQLLRLGKENLLFSLSPQRLARSANQPEFR